MNLLRSRPMWHGTDLACDSPEVNTWVNRIYRELTRTFTNVTSTDDKITRARQSMEFISPLSSSWNIIARKSYNLFCVAFPVGRFPHTFTQNQLNILGVAICSAFDRNGMLPLVDDPDKILRYLQHAFNSVTGGGPNLDEPIRCALRALTYACNDNAKSSLDDFIPTRGWFLSGLCYVLGGDKPVQFHKVALHFLPRVSDKLFRAQTKLRPGQMRLLCANWVHTVKSVLRLDEGAQADVLDVQADVLKVLFTILDANHWSPYIIPRIWTLLESVASIPDPEPLRLCLGHPRVVAAIRDAEDPDVITDLLMAVQLKHEELVHLVWELVPEERQREWEQPQQQRQDQQPGVARELIGHFSSHAGALLVDCNTTVGNWLSGRQISQDL